MTCVTSSANMTSLLFSPAGGGMSLVYNIYEVGDNIPPCGTPLSRVILSPLKFSI